MSDLRDFIKSLKGTPLEEVNPPSFLFKVKIELEKIRGTLWGKKFCEHFPCFFFFGKTDLSNEMVERRLKDLEFFLVLIDKKENNKIFYKLDKKGKKRCYCLCSWKSEELRFYIFADGPDVPAIIKLQEEIHSVLGANNDSFDYTPLRFCGHGCP